MQLFSYVWSAACLNDQEMTKWWWWEDESHTHSLFSFFLYLSLSLSEEGNDERMKEMMERENSKGKLCERMWSVSKYHLREWIFFLSDSLSLSYTSSLRSFLILTSIVVVVLTHVTKSNGMGEEEKENVSTRDSEKWGREREKKVGHRYDTLARKETSCGERVWVRGRERWVRNRERKKVYENVFSPATQHNRQSKSNNTTFLSNTTTLPQECLSSH